MAYVLLLSLTNCGDIRLLTNREMEERLSRYCGQEFTVISSKSVSNADALELWWAKVFVVSMTRKRNTGVCVVTTKSLFQKLVVPQRISGIDGQLLRAGGHRGRSPDRCQGPAAFRHRPALSSFRISHIHRFDVLSFAVLTVPGAFIPHIPGSNAGSPLVRCYFYVVIPNT